MIIRRARVMFEQARGPLAGLLVADFSRVLAGPYATMLLGDLGAEIVKIERADGGDETRAWGPPWSGGVSTYFQAVNRNKTSFALDLSRETDRDAALELCLAADVVVENFKTGAMARFGLGAERLLAGNPRLVFCSITGFGSDRGADLPGYDLVIQAVGGLMSITGEPGGEPTKVGVAIVDIVAGLHAVTAILAALRHRDATGEGQCVEVSLMSSVLSALVNQASGYLNAGAIPHAMGNRHPSIAPYELVAAADRPLVLAVGNDGQFRALCTELGAASVADDPRFATNSARVEHRDDLIALLEKRLRAASAEEWVARLGARGVPCGLVNTVDEAIAMAGRVGLEPVVEMKSADGRSSRQIRHPVRYSATAPSYRSVPPAWNEVSDAAGLSGWLAARRTNA